MLARRTADLETVHEYAIRPVVWLVIVLVYAHGPRLPPEGLELPVWSPSIRASIGKSKASWFAMGHPGGGRRVRGLKGAQAS